MQYGTHRRASSGERSVRAIALVAAVLIVAVAVFHHGIGAQAPAHGTVQDTAQNADQDTAQFNAPSEYLYAIGNGDRPGGFRTVGGLAVGPDGHVHMTDQSSHRVHVTDDGHFVRLWGGPGDATVFVADTLAWRVQAFDREGELVSSWAGYPDPARPDRSARFGPRRVALTPDGLVVTDDWLRNHVLVFESDGTFVRRWDVPAGPSGSQSEVRALTVSDSGDVILARGDGSVGRFALDGTPISEWELPGVLDMAATDGRCYYVGDTIGLTWTDLDGNSMGQLPIGTQLDGRRLESPAAVGLDGDGTVFVADRDEFDRQSWLLELRADGMLVHQTHGGVAAPGVMGPSSISRDMTSNVLVADEQFGRVQVLAADGLVTDVWGTSEILVPVGIAFSLPDHVYVSDAASKAVFRLDGDGHVGLTFGDSTGAAPGEFGDIGPTDLALAPEISSAPHHLRVVDPDNARVQMFDADGNWSASAGTEGDGDGQFCQGCASQVVGDVVGHTHVSEYGPQLRIQVFGLDGAYLRSYRGRIGEDSRITGVFDLAFGAGHIFMAEMRQRVQVLDTDGSHVTDIHTYAARPDMTIEPRAIAVAPGASRMFVADPFHHRIHVFGSERNAQWHVTYHPNAWVTDAPVVVSDTKQVAFEWGDGAPSPELDANAFSMRATGFVEFPEGVSKVHVAVDGKTRLWIDDELVIDEWREVRGVHSATLVDLGEGTHFVQLEYADTSGDAIVALTVGDPGPGGWVTPVHPTPQAATPTQSPSPTPTSEPWGASMLSLPLLAND